MQKEFGVTVETQKNMAHANGWRIPLVYKHGHLYREIPVNSVLFAERELISLKKKFGHASPRMLYSPMKKIGALLRF